MEYGFKDFSGQVWASQWIDTYNNLTRQIDQYQTHHGENDHLEKMKNDRHRFFQSCVNVGRACKSNRKREIGIRRTM